ncbi:hypothetical protein Clacol_007971 [Clathrus columnatus]|uniref:FAD-binding domain-containing protein n=1 Tax=Clathrus columnatus TaxID=1419009 RepID=A0AAV5ALG3_9AGAM|nr:hypothetical protein Clacol_007971 [Clathrus columnatus]
MIPKSFERLNSDTYDLIFQYLCDIIDENQTYRSQALIPLSLVCKSLRSETLRWLFREIHWKIDLHNEFLPHNLLCYVRTLRITANNSINPLDFNEEELHLIFSKLKNTMKLIVCGERGASQFLLSLLTLMPALGTLEWNDVLFTDAKSDFSKLTGIFQLAYIENRIPHLTTLQLENRHLATIISSSAHSLSHLNLPGRRVSQDVLSNSFFPKLQTLVLTGYAPRTYDCPLYQYFQQMPNLQNLQTRLCLGPPFEIYPDIPDHHTNNPQKNNIPMIHSLTMYNTVPTDRILHNLPSTLQYLSFAQHPYPYEIIREHGHKHPRLILNSKISYLNRPKLGTSDMLLHFQHCNLNKLRELRLAISGTLSPSWFSDLSLTLPELEILELHYWQPGTEEKSPTIGYYESAFVTFNKLSVLRLDLHLADESDDSLLESEKVEPQLSRAKKIALQAGPSLKLIGFLEGHAIIEERGTANPTFFWRMFGITHKQTPTGTELIIAQCASFRPYRSGGGIGGLSLALALTKYEDIEIDVYEAAGVFKDIGAGIGIWGRGIAALREWGLEEKARTIATAVPNQYDDVKFQIRRSDQLTEGELMGYFVTSTNLGFHRSQFVSFLAEELIKTGRATAHFKKRCVSVSQKEGNEENEFKDLVTIYFADGTKSTCDVLVGSDGIKSAVRASLLYGDPTEEGKPVTKEQRFAGTKFCGTVAYRALVDPKELGKINPNHDAIKERKMHLVSYPVAGGKFLNFIAYSSDPSRYKEWAEGEWECTANADEVIQYFNDFEPQVQEFMKCIGTTSRWAMYDLTPLPYWSKGHITLLGDAAHATTPFIGSGGGQVLEDAYVLSNLLGSQLATRQTLPAVLRAYEHVRKTRANNVITCSTRARNAFEFLGEFENGSNEDIANAIGEVSGWLSEKLGHPRDDVLEAERLIKEGIA